MASCQSVSASRTLRGEMTSRPVIFISAVSKELSSARDLVAKVVHLLGYEPKWQDVAATG